jgi:hypothetical protein
MSNFKTDGRLSSLPFFSELTYSDLCRVESLIKQGADELLLYFWFNATHGFYRVHPEQVFERDQRQMITLYPNFAAEIRIWGTLINIDHNPTELTDIEKQIIAQANWYMYTYGVGMIWLSNDVSWDCTNSAAAKQYLNDLKIPEKK